MRRVNQGSPRGGEQPAGLQPGAASAVEDADRSRFDVPWPVPMAMQHQVAAALQARHELLAVRELGGVGKAEPRGQLLQQVVVGELEQVVVEEQQAQRSRRRLIEGLADRVHVLVIHSAMGVEPPLVVRAGRIESDDEQATMFLRLNAGPGHQRAGDVLAEAIVVAGNDDDAPLLEQRRERGMEPVELAATATVGDVTR